MDSSSSSSSSSSSGSRQRRTLFFRGVIVCAAAAALSRQGGRRYIRTSAYWKRPRNYKAYYRLVRNCSDDLYQKYFHVSKSTFYFVLHTIRDHPRLQRNCRRGDYLKPEEQLAIALSYLAQGGSFSLVGGLWGCSVTSVHRCVNAVSHAIRARLSSFMALPSTDEEWQELVVGFSDFVRLRWGIQVGLPQVVLAMDGCQVPIMHAPPNTGHEFYNYKGFYSFNVHGVCDHRGVFRDVLAGLPGRCHDFYCFERSGLGRQLMDRGSNVVQAFERGARLLGGTTVPYLICADSAYPSRRYILPAFKPNETQGNAAYLSYNLKHGSTRNVIERAFGQVKSRFRCLHHGVRTYVTITPYIIMACFLLHNVCIIRGAPAVDPRGVPRYVRGVMAAQAHYPIRLHAPRRAAQAAVQEGRDIREAVVGFAFGVQ